MCYSSPKFRAVLKRCVTAVQSNLLSFSNYSALLAIKLNVCDEITASGHVQTKYVSRALNLNLQTIEINFEYKTVQPNSFSEKQHPRPSVRSFVFAVLFKPLVNDLSGYFYVSLIWWPGPQS